MVNECRENLEHNSKKSCYVTFFYFFIFIVAIGINPCFTMRYITGYLQCLQLGLLCYYVTAVGVAQGCLWALVLFWLVLQHV